MPKGLKKNRF